MIIRKIFLFAAAASTIFLSSAKAELFLTFEQTSENIVTATVSGSFNLSTLSFAYTMLGGNGEANLAPSWPFFGNMPESQINHYNVVDSSGGEPFGPDGFRIGTYISGSYFEYGIYTLQIGFASDYVSGTPFSSIAQFTGTLASIYIPNGVNQTITFTNGENTDKMHIRAVPEPTTIGLALLSLGALALRRRR